MSANNYILIDRDTLEVTHRNADGGKVMETIGKGKSLDEAVDIATKFQDELEKEGMPVEYGIEFTRKKK